MTRRTRKASGQPWSRRAAKPAARSVAGLSACHGTQELNASRLSSAQVDLRAGGEGAMASAAASSSSYRPSTRDSSSCWLSADAISACVASRTVCRKIRAGTNTHAAGGERALPAGRPPLRLRCPKPSSHKGDRRPRASAATCACARPVHTRRLVQTIRYSSQHNTVIVASFSPRL